MDNLNTFWHCGKKLNLSIFVDFAHSSLAKRGDSMWHVANTPVCSPATGNVTEELW